MVSHFGGSARGQKKTTRKPLHGPGNKEKKQAGTLKKEKKKRKGKERVKIVSQYLGKEKGGQIRGGGEKEKQKKKKGKQFPARAEV